MNLSRRDFMKANAAMAAATAAGLAIPVKNVEPLKPKSNGIKRYVVSVVPVVLY